MSKNSVENFIKNHTKEEISDYYQNHTHDETCKYYHIGYYSLEKVLNYFGIEKHVKIVLDADAFIEKYKDELIEYYSTHNISETRDYFHISRDTLYEALEKLEIRRDWDDAMVLMGSKHELNVQDFIDTYGAETILQYYDTHNIADCAAHFKTRRQNMHKVLEALGRNSKINRKKYNPEAKGYTYSKKEVQQYYDTHNVNELSAYFHTFHVYEFLNYYGIEKREHITSITNQNFGQKLKDLGIEFEPEFRLEKKYFDFKVGNILIELNPTETHNIDWSPYPRDNRLTKDYHKMKSDIAKYNNFRCIHIWDWDNKNAIIKNLLPKTTIGARECQVKLVDRNDAINFIDDYHIQGYAKDKIRIGLFYENKLVSIMTFAKPRYNKNYEWEIIRYCSSLNILGGAEKLFKYFISIYKPNSMISYCDNSKFTGDTYIKLGFKLLRVSKPTCHWCNIKTKQHITDNMLRKNGFDRLFDTNYGKGTSNETLMLQNGFVRVYDCGQSTFEWYNN